MCMNIIPKIQNYVAYLVAHKFPFWNLLWIFIARMELEVFKVKIYKLIWGPGGIAPGKFWNSEIIF